MAVDLTGVEWAYVIYRLDDNEWPSAYTRYNRVLRYYGLCVRPRVFLLPRLSVAAATKDLGSGRAGRKHTPKIFITYVHPATNAAAVALIEDALTRDLRELYKCFSEKYDAAIDAQGWLSDRVGYEVLLALFGARSLMSNIDYCDELSDAYETLRAGWERYYNEVYHAVSVDKTRTPVSPTRYRTLAGRWFNRVRTPLLRGMDISGKEH